MNRGRLNALPVTISGIILMWLVALSVTHESVWMVVIITVIILIGIVGEIYFALNEAKDKEESE